MSGNEDVSDDNDQTKSHEDETETAKRQESSEHDPEVPSHGDIAMQHTVTDGEGATSGAGAVSESQLAQTDAFYPENNQDHTSTADRQEGGGVAGDSTEAAPAYQNSGGKAKKRRNEYDHLETSQQPRTLEDISQQIDGKSSADNLRESEEDADQDSPADAPSRQDRRLGDLAKAWMRRLEAIPDEVDGNIQDDVPTMNASADLEYTQNDGKEEDLQAAGPAEDDHLKDTSHRPLESEMFDESQAMSNDEVVRSAAAADQRDHRILHIDDSENKTDPFSSSTMAPERYELEDEFPAFDSPPDQKQLEGSAHDIPWQLQHWYEDGRQSIPSAEVWRLYEGMTRTLSFSLTESLRLVLEPTRATRLRGDFRTGKRLNMKKIIPYIASDFTKDKIWMRRTRPSQREYQILLALDDSRSMADSHSVHLAYQALALVSQALTRLEVGEISVCRFGETVDFIHTFKDGPIRESSGASIVDAFTFGQRSTDVRQLIQRSLDQLADAREIRRGSSAAIWQMEIIISDGICQDLDDIRYLLRKAMEQKIMIVFVVIDSLHQVNARSSGMNSTRNSILSMNSVSYVNGRDGALELKMERYMDTFPFEYYVVLRDVEALPEVLSETLRQFFERAS